MDSTTGAEDARLTEDEASGSDKAIPLRADSNGTPGQTFSRIHTTGHSRSHFGNVYNHYYHYDQDNQSDHDDVAQPHEVHAEQQRSIHAKVQELMGALAFDGMGDRLMAISPAYVNTCAWFLRTAQYANWRDPYLRQSHNGVLWMKGNAGSGKSTLMRYIYDCAQKQQDDTVNIAFFYNGRSPDALVKSTEGMYRSVIHQLYKRIPRLGQTAAQRISATTLRPWSLMILEELLRQAILSLTPEERVICYIDALDECELDQIRSAIGFFEQLSESATLADIHFNLCLASRHYPKITMRSHEEAKIDAMPPHLQDIATYVTNRLTLPPAIKYEMQAEIQQRCWGIFLWVVLVVDLLRKSFDRGATRSQLHETLNSLPRELDALFAKISEAADAGYTVAMRWVLFAERSLTPMELYLAIQAGSGQLEPEHWDAEDADTTDRYILHVSRGLIESQRTDGGGVVMQFIHESVREYLLSHGQACRTPVSQQVRKAENHAKIAEDCQSYLRYHTRASVYRRIEHRLPEYVLLNVFKHIEIAHIGGAIDFTPVGFPIREYIALHDVHKSSYEDYIVPGHSAALLMLLIEYRCFAAAEAVVRKSARSDLRTADHVQQDLTSDATPGAHTKLDLFSLCGGVWGSPLHAAVHARQEALIRLLLNRGANIDCRGEVTLHGITQQYNSPLSLAMRRAPAIVQLLLAHGASIDFLSPKNGLNALHQACKNFDIAMVKLLLSRGADVALPCRLEPDWHSLGRSTVLHVALASDETNSVFELISILLAAGANVNAIDAKGMTPLHVAISENQNDEVLRSLLAAGANVDATDAKGRTALVIAASKGRSIKVQTLLDHKANIDHHGNCGGSRTAIEIAHSHGHEQIVKILQTEVRLRALKGLNPKAALPTPSIYPNTSKKQPSSRIPAPAQSQCRRRTKRPLQYRRLSPHQPEKKTSEEADMQGFSIFSHSDSGPFPGTRRKARGPHRRLRPPAPSPPPFRYSQFAHEAKSIS